MSGVLTVDDKIIYTKYQLDSDQLIEKVHGITRDTQNYVTAIPLDYFLVGKSITSNTSLIAPNCRSNTFTFLSDTDTNGVPRFQTKAFTNEMGSFIDNIITNKTLTLGTSTIAEVSSHLTLTSPSIKCDGILSMTNSTSANRSIYCSFYNILGDNVTSDGRMWLGATSLYIQNHLNSGDITFHTRDVAGTQSVRMSLSKTAIQINADTINSVGSAINVNASTAYGCTSPIISFAATTLNLGGLVPTLYTTYLSTGSLTFGDSTTQNTAFSTSAVTSAIGNGITLNQNRDYTSNPLVYPSNVGSRKVQQYSSSLNSNSLLSLGTFTVPYGTVLITQSWSFSWSATNFTCTSFQAGLCSTTGPGFDGKDTDYGPGVVKNWIQFTMQANEQRLNISHVYYNTGQLPNTLTLYPNVYAVFTGTGTLTAACRITAVVLA